MKMYTKRTPIKASKDYADLNGMDFKKARDLLTKDGFHEHEYGDKDNNTGYAVYRKGDQEVELQYRWIHGKRKGDAHAGKVTNVYVDEDINSATKVRSRKAIKAGYSPKEILWVLDYDNTWKCWGSVGPKMKSMSDAELLDSLNSHGNNYIDVLITKNGENPDEYGRTESVKDPFIRESTRIRSRRAIKASTAPKQYEVAIDRGENEPLLVKFFDNNDDALKYADDVHDRGFAVRITDNETGETEELGEFESYWNTMTDVESSQKLPNDGWNFTSNNDTFAFLYNHKWYNGTIAGNKIKPYKTLEDCVRGIIDTIGFDLAKNSNIEISRSNSAGYSIESWDADEVQRLIRDELADAVWNIQHGDVESSVCASTSSTTNPGIIDVLEANGFESAGIDEPWWDKNLWLRFGCTYNAESQDAYVWWNPDGNMVELPYEYSVKTVQDANALCDDLYTWDEYDIGELLEAGLPLKGATKVGDGQYEYSDSGETAFIDINMNSGYVIDAYGDKTEYNNLQDLLEEIGIIR